MNLRRPVYALGAGLAAFVIVGVVVTEIASKWIAFSLLLGLPAGLLVGLLVGAFVSLNLRSPPGSMTRRAAFGLGAFGVTFVIVLLSATIGLGIRNSRALPIAGVAGVIAAVATTINPPGESTAA